MNLRRFLFKSFGILTLMASALALLSCRGPWLQSFPSWFVIVPLGISILLLRGGITLLRTPTAPGQTTGTFTKALMYIIIAGAAAGGLVLTHFFHGDSAADQGGIETLGRICEKLGIAALVLILAVVIGRLTTKGKQKEILKDI